MSKYNAIVFFDLDRTLLDSHKHIEDSSIEALKLLKLHHILPVIASGRNVSLIQPIVHKTRINNAVCDNGANLIYHGKSVFSEVIPTKTIQKLLKVTSKFHDPLAYQAKNGVALTSKKYVPKHSIARYDYPSVIPDYYKHKSIIYLSLFTADPAHDKYYQKVFKGDLSLVRNCSVCLDVTRVGVNKGSGVAHMLKVLHLQDIPSYCFGNGLNDIPMFKQVNYPIAMGNGRECKDYAKYITTDCDHDGIFNGLKHYHLI